MKKILKSIFVYLFWNAILFLAISFYYVDFNISHWEEGARYIFAVLGMIVGLCPTGFYYFLNKPTK